jgi:hypothetical protein
MLFEMNWHFEVPTRFCGVLLTFLCFVLIEIFRVSNRRRLKNVNQGSGPRLTAGLQIYLQDEGAQQTRGGRQSRRGGMSILRGPASPPWGLRRIFEMPSIT